ncbi:cation-translocating P-type ATPase C-terminal domain-containing protein [Methylobacterium isbiliense]|nr:cation-translocating P-type ATPase C-terminal domain-containing protein [Methylobacterium isbiliense]MDN3625945.1 cation-translocating P-type ATPase C-terminal domain-containing protein [Methylobacterium isbiliense]
MPTEALTSRATRSYYPEVGWLRSKHLWNAPARLKHNVQKTTAFLAPQLGLPDPLAPIQILWVAMIMDGPPAVALGFDVPRPGLMQEPPRDPKEQILSGRRLASVLGFGAVMAAVSAVGTRETE